MPSQALRVCLLGSLRITTAAGDDVSLASVVQRRLLSILALDAGTVVPARRLHELLDCSEGALRTTISRVRREIGHGSLVTEPPGYLLRGVVTDIEEFTQLIAESRIASNHSRINLLGNALTLWRGDALAEFFEERWALPDLARLNELRAAAVEQRADAMLGEQMHDQAIADMERHIIDFPLRDRPQAILMRALAQAGRKAEALRAFQDFRNHLAQVVGTEPSARLRSIEQQIVSDAVDADQVTKPW